MAATKPRLSLEDRIIIAKHPFGDAIDTLRYQLHTAAASLDPWNAHETKAPLILTQLLVTLMADETASHLKLPRSETNLASDLGRMIERMDPNKSKPSSFECEPFQTLIQAVLDRKTDVEIWELVFALVDGYLRPDSARSSSSTETLETLTFPQPPSNAAADRALQSQALTDKVYIADVVERNDFFFPFEPAARPRELYKEREEFAQAILRDLDRLYIRIIDEEHDYEAFKKITKGVRSLGPQFALWQFEVVLFHVVKKLNIELADFEVFRGLQAWKDMRNGKGTAITAHAPQRPEIESVSSSSNTP